MAYRLDIESWLKDMCSKRLYGCLCGSGYAIANGDTYRAGVYGHRGGSLQVFYSSAMPEVGVLDVYAVDDEGEVYVSVSDKSKNGFVAAVGKPCTLYYVCSVADNSVERGSLNMVSASSHYYLFEKPFDSDKVTVCVRGYTDDSEVAVKVEAIDRKGMFVRAAVDCKLDYVAAEVNDNLKT